MNLPVPNRIVSGVLIALLLFGAVSSFGGAVLAIAFDGAGVPKEWLANSPFTSYLAWIHRWAGIEGFMANPAQADCPASIHTKAPKQRTDHIVRLLDIMDLSEIGA